MRDGLSKNIPKNGESINLFIRLTVYKKSPHMKNLFKAAFLIISVSLLTGCSVFKKPKEGCPTNGKNIGAERILSGEKVPKAKKFKG